MKDFGIIISRWFMACCDFAPLTSDMDPIFNHQQLESLCQNEIIKRQNIAAEIIQRFAKRHILSKYSHARNPKRAKRAAKRGSRISPTTTIENVFSLQQSLYQPRNPRLKNILRGLASIDTSARSTNHTSGLGLSPANRKYQNPGAFPTLGVLKSQTNKVGKKTPTNATSSVASGSQPETLPLLPPSVVSSNDRATEKNSHIINNKPNAKSPKHNSSRGTSPKRSQRSVTLYYPGVLSNDLGSNSSVKELDSVQQSSSEFDRPPSTADEALIELILPEKENQSTRNESAYSNSSDIHKCILSDERHATVTHQRNDHPAEAQHHNNVNLALTQSEAVDYKAMEEEQSITQQKDISIACEAVSADTTQEEDVTQELIQTLESARTLIRDLADELEVELKKTNNNVKNMNEIEQANRRNEWTEKLRCTLLSALTRDNQALEQAPIHDGIEDSGDWEKEERSFLLESQDMSLELSASTVDFESILGSRSLAAYCRSPIHSRDRQKTRSELLKELRLSNRIVIDLAEELERLSYDRATSPQVQGSAVDQNKELIPSNEDIQTRLGLLEKSNGVISAATVPMITNALHGENKKENGRGKDMTAASMDEDKKNAGLMLLAFCRLKISWGKVLPIFRTLDKSTDPSAVMEAVRLSGRLNIATLVVKALHKFAELFQQQFTTTMWSLETMTTLNNIQIHFSDHYTVNLAGCHVLLALSIKITTLSSDERSAVMNNLRASGLTDAIKRLFCVSCVRSSETLLLQRSCAVLSLICNVDLDTCSYIGSIDVFEALNIALCQSTSDVTSTMSLIRLLITLNHNNLRNQDLAGLSGTCGYMAQVLNNWKFEKLIVSLACHAVLTLCSLGHEYNMRLFAASGIGRIILDCLEIHSLNLAVVKKLCTITVCITLSSSYCKSIFVEAGLVDEVLRILVTPRVSRQIALLGMWVIGCLGMPESSTMKDCLDLLTSMKTFEKERSDDKIVDSIVSRSLLIPLCS